MNRNITIKPEVAKQFKKAMDSGQTVLFSAPCGMGKSASAHALLEGRRVLEIWQENRSFEYPNLTEAGMFSL